MTQPPPILRSIIYRKIKQPRALICVKTSPHTEKTSVITEIKQEIPQGYQAVSVQFQRSNNALTSSDRLFQWFCTQITQQLQLKNTLAESWQEGISSKMNCSNYFETYLLPNIKTALVIVLYNVELILEYQAIANNFFELLRSWHNNAANENGWEKLRLVIVHSQDISLTGNVPFNVGVLIKFREPEAGQSCFAYL
ncbi:AAA-like domain-containing protein [Limnofasciculus baicalensis]|uniref:AAA-like domain-containing protein n=1 Tax=Limnofasciculus baicalensis TaxID=3064906 RepID=UPI00359FD9E2